MMSRKIALTQGKFALVDDTDYEWLNQYKWCALKGRNTFYAVRMSPRVSGKQAIIWMHREILGLGKEDPQQGDHRNHNGLDNRRGNLRICNNSQNQHNKSPQKNSSSAFKGVCWDKQYCKWHAHIRVDSKLKHLGRFNSEIVAAKVYDKAALKNFGEFAFTNF